MTELRPGITACVAAHPARFRNGLLARALNSICRQSLQPDAVIVVNDQDKLGAGWTRRQILGQITTTKLAWLDSDDYWYANHLADLNALYESADDIKYVFPWFDGRNDPLGHFGKEYNLSEPHHTTITSLVDTALAQEIGYRDTDMNWPVSNEDLMFIFDFAKMCLERGYRIVHLPKKTWYWEQAGQNTSGKPNQGDAVQ